MIFRILVPENVLKLGNIKGLKLARTFNFLFLSHVPSTNFQTMFSFILYVFFNLEHGFQNPPFKIFQFSPLPLPLSDLVLICSLTPPLRRKSGVVKHPVLRNMQLQNFGILYINFGKSMCRPTMVCPEEFL